MSGRSGSKDSVTRRYGGGAPQDTQRAKSLRIDELALEVRLAKRSEPPRNRDDRKGLPEIRLKELSSFFGTKKELSSLPVRLGLIAVVRGGRVAA